MNDWGIRLTEKNNKPRKEAPDYPSNSKEVQQITGADIRTMFGCIESLISLKYQIIGLQDMLDKEVIDLKTFKRERKECLDRINLENSIINDVFTLRRTDYK